MSPIGDENEAIFDLPEYFNIAEACLSSAKPKTPALIFVSETGTREQLSYSALNQRMSICAQAFREAGLKKGERIAICTPNIPSFPIAFFAALSLGAIAVPLSYQLKPSELQYILEDAGARHWVTTEEKLFEVHEAEAQLAAVGHVWLVDTPTSSDPSHLVPTQIHTLDTQALNAGTPSFEKTLATDPAYLVYTSGTTGFPKGVLHAHRALVGRLPASIDWFDYQSEDRILHTGKFNWTYVLGTGLMDPLYQDQTVVVYDGPNDPQQWIDLIAQEQCSVLIGVPAIFRQILKHTDAEAADIPSLRHCMSAGEHLPDSLIEQWQGRFALNIYEAVGMSECSYYLSQRARDPIRPGSAGKPQRGHQVALLDQALQPVQLGEEGMLCIHKTDPGLFLEYWNLPDVTAKAFNGDYFLTGDYAHIDEAGYIWFHGRKDDIINTFGYRVSPLEIERVMKGHSGIHECIALGQDIGQNRQIIVLAVKTNSTTVTETELLAYAHQHLADYKTPKNIRFVEDFPLTSNGKIIRAELAQRLLSE